MRKDKIAKNWIKRSKSSMDLPSLTRFRGVPISKGNDIYVTDVDGNQYIDFTAQYCNVGHSHPKVIRAVQQQIETGGLFAGDPPKIILTEKIKKIAPRRLSDGRVGLCRGGTSAIEYTILLARAYSKRTIILSFQGSYHGESLGALSLTMSRSELRRGFHPFISDIVPIPYPYCYRCPHGHELPNCAFQCTDYIEYVLQTVAHPEDVAAFFIEPIQVHGGVVVPPDQYFRKLRKICDKYRILLVDDEVVTGFGRTGEMFAIQHWGITPDIMLMGKPIAAGLPLGAVIGGKELMKYYRGHGANPVACAAAIANIKVILNEKLVEAASKVGEHMMRRLREMQEQHESIGEVRGKGLIIGVELVKNRHEKTPATQETRKVIQQACRKGLLMVPVGTYQQVVRIAPPLTLKIEQADKALDIFSTTLRELNL